MSSTLAFGLAACGSQSTPTAPATVASVAVTGTAPGVGASASFSATATLSDGTTQTVTSQATWASSNPSVATVNAGTVSGLAPGEADITATYQNVTGRAHATIVSAVKATYTLTGTVIDGTSGGVLPNIDIQASDSAGKTLSTKSGSAGTYTIGGLAAGTVGVTAAATSYQSATQTVALSSDLRVDIVLKRVTCAFSVTPATFSFSSAGGQGMVRVVSQVAGCTWTATGNDAFLTIPSGASGLDNGAVTFSVAPDPIFYLSDLNPRTGTMTIAGTTVTVRQDAPRLNTGVYDPALNASVCQSVGEGCIASGSFSACPAGSRTESILFIFVATPDGTPLAAGKPVNIFIFADYTMPTVQIAADAQRLSWNQLIPYRASNKSYALNAVLPSGGLQAVRAGLGNVTTLAGAGPCGNIDNLDVAFRVQ